jgi:hypothetical protein
MIGKYRQAALVCVGWIVSVSRCLSPTGVRFGPAITGCRSGFCDDEVLGLLREEIMGLEDMWLCKEKWI